MPSNPIVNLAAVAAGSLAVAAAAIVVAGQPAPRPQIRTLRVSGRTTATVPDVYGRQQVTYSETVTNTGNVPARTLVVHGPLMDGNIVTGAGVGDSSPQVSCGLGTVDTPTSFILGNLYGPFTPYSGAVVGVRRRIELVPPLVTPAHPDFGGTEPDGELCTVSGRGLPPGQTVKLSLQYDTNAFQPTALEKALREGVTVTFGSDGYALER